MLDFISHYAIVLVVSAIFAGYMRHVRASPRVGSDAAEPEDDAPSLK